MKNFKMQKLVRDKLVKIIEERNNIVISRVLDDKQFFGELKSKLIEEVKELGEVDLDDKENLKNELVDVQLVLNYLKKLAGFLEQELNEVQRKKVANAGGFDKRIFVETVALQDDDPWLETYRKKGFEEIK